MYIKQLIDIANKSYTLGQSDDIDVIHKLMRTYIDISPTLLKIAETTKPRVILVRHGQTDFNGKDGDKSAERLRGWLDIPLSSPIGYIQAEKLGQYFLNFPISQIYCSDLSRAHDTAKAIQRYTNAPLTISSKLRPFNLGHVMGKSVKEYIPVLLEHINNDKQVPEGSTESFFDFQVRFLSKMTELMKEAIDGSCSVMAVAHSRNTRCYRDFILSGANDIENITKETLLQKDDIVNTGHFMIAEYDGQKWSVIDLPQEVLDK